MTTNQLSWSDEIYRIFGCQPQEFAATYDTFLGFVHPDDRATVNDAYSQSLREGRDGYEIEHRIVRRDSGDVRHVFGRCDHERDDAGTIVKSVGMVQDITERKQAEVEFQRFKTISDNAVYGNAIADLQGNILYINGFFANIHGYEPEELMGKHFSLFHNEKQMDTANTLIATMFREGFFAPTTVWHCHRDGTEFPMLMSGIIVNDDYGNPQYMAATVVDATLQVQTENALQATVYELKKSQEVARVGGWVWHIPPKRVNSNSTRPKGRYSCGKSITGSKTTFPV